VNKAGNVIAALEQELSMPRLSEHRHQRFHSGSARLHDVGYELSHCVVNSYPSRKQVSSKAVLIEIMLAPSKICCRGSKKKRENSVSEWEPKSEPERHRGKATCLRHLARQNSRVVLGDRQDGQMNQKQINAKPKSVARLIIGAIIIGAVANSLRRPGAWGRDSTEAIIFLLLNPVTTGMRDPFLERNPLEGASVCDAG
jgi:hypothetical protein